MHGKFIGALFSLLLSALTNVSTVYKSMYTHYVDLVLADTA